ncbi:MAG: molybdate ABC transporter substrate-binding protein [Micrococcales bacterium]|nr:molybdate ABC transporter substrate-binding protein [Micrococcales bacterium]
MACKPANVWSAALALLAGCTGDAGPGEPPPAGAQVTVFAAASLQKTFTRLGEQFEASHPGATVAFTFGGSSDLVAQLLQGAPADVFASADPATMDEAVSDGLIAGESEVFATNSMEIAVPPGNPAGVTSFASLADPGTTVVVCAPQVPCGAATVTVEENTGVDLAPVSEENSVADVLGKVSSGEADAGVVYVTDVQAAGAAVEGVEIPASDNAVNIYPIGVLEASTNATLAEAFQAHVLSPQGQKVLTDAGFGTP